MATDATSHRTGDSPPFDAVSRARGLAAVLALALAYIGFLVGAPAPDLRVASNTAALQAVQGAQHLAARDGARATVVAGRLDPRAPAPPPPAARLPALADLPVPVAAAARRTPPRSSRTARARPYRAHAPRAPPSLPA
jgi:hypothetical protein